MDEWNSHQSRAKFAPGYIFEQFIRLLSCINHVSLKCFQMIHAYGVEFTKYLEILLMKEIVYRIIIFELLF